jgi:hypothetical protein
MSKDIVIRCPEEFNNWIETIRKEFKLIRGFEPTKKDLIRNIVKQFKGKFIV